MPYYFPDGITGGAEKQAYLLAKELVKRGHEVHFLTSNPKGKPEEEEDEGIRVLRVLKRTGKFQFLDYPTVMSRLCAIQPDVVVSRIRFYYLPISLYAILRRRLSVAFVPENSLSLPFPEVRKTLQDMGRGKVWKAPAYLLHAFALDLMAQLGLVLSKRIVVQNEEQRRNVRRFFFRRAHKLPSIFVPPKVSVVKEDTPLIVWVENVRKTKRPEEFLNLARRFPEYRFAMVGRKTEQFRGVLPNLTATGELPHEEALRWIARAWVLVNTSRGEGEGFPNVFLEAWYLRTVVMTYGADPDGLVSSGLGIRVGSTDEAEAELRDLLRDEERMEVLRERGHRYVRETHLPEVVIPRFLNLLGSHP